MISGVFTFTAWTARGKGMTRRDLVISVERNSDNFRVIWSIAPALAARQGTLYITDGPFQRTVEMDTTLLREGSVIYFRTDAEVTFRLEVSASNGILSTETVRLPPVSSQADCPKPEIPMTLHELHATEPVKSVVSGAPGDRPASEAVYDPLAF